APLAFTMLQRTRISKGNSIFWGNASLGGQLSHVLEGFNVTQVLPLEPPDAWARRQPEGLVPTPTPPGPSVPSDTQSLRCHLGCRLYPDGSAHSFYEMTLNGTSFLSFHVPNATWERRWPRAHEVAAFAEKELMKYPETTRHLQHFLDTTCVGILRAQSAWTGERSGRSHAPLVVGLVLGTFALLGTAVGIFLCTGGSC
ncbi:Endothelial protein C receptor, partial [Merops nubicus]